jgi:hypothetical protein
VVRNPPGAGRADRAPRLTEAPRGARRRTWLLPCAALLVLAGALWGPFGLSATGLVEEWTYYAAFDRGQWPIATDVIMPVQPNRLFVLLAYGIGYWLTPDSFVGLEVVQVLLFIGKGLALYAIVRRLLPDLPGVAFASVVLLVVYPADRGLVSPRLVAYHAAVFFYLLAVHGLLRYWDRPTWPRLVLTWAALALSLGTYEVAYPLVAATPLLVAGLGGGFGRRVRRAAALWYVVLTVHAIWIVAVMLRPTSYHHSLLGLRPPGDGVGWRAYVRITVGGWQDATATLASDSWFATTGLALAIAAGTVVGALCWADTGTAGGATPTGRLLVALLAALLAIGLGFASFLPLPTHRGLTERVFLLPSVGGATLVALVLHLATVRRPGGRLVFSGAVGALIVLAMVGALGQQQEVRLASLAAQRTLAGLARAVPEVAPGTTVLLLDGMAPRSSLLAEFAVSVTSGHLADAVRFLYHDSSLRVFLCDQGGRPRSPGAERCETTPSAVRVSLPGAVITIPYAHAVLLQARGVSDLAVLERPSGAAWPTPTTGSDSADAPARLGAAGPRRAATLLERWPLEPAPYVGARRWLRLQFDRDVPGWGWHPPEGSAAWMSGTTSTLDLWLEPGRAYRLACRVVASLLPDSPATLSLAVNGRSVDLARRADGRGGTIFEASVPKSAVALDPRKTELTFRIARAVSPRSLGLNDDRRTLGLLFDWLRVDPLPGS